MMLFGLLLWFKTGNLFKYCDNMLHPNNNVRPKCPVAKKRTIHMMLGIVFCVKFTEWREKTFVYYISEWIVPLNS